ncbi:MAG: methyl-accepting chemotaxis protein, partial [Syntrophothermus sp.]
DRGMGDSNIIMEIENEFKEISLSLSKNSDIRIELTNSMKIVTDTVKNLSGYVDEIEEIGSEIELIALNSSIKAVRTGSEGAALGVLADSIQKLSGDAKVQTRSMSELLKKISNSSEILYQNTEFNTGNRNYQELRRIASAITEEVENLSRLDKESADHLNGLKSSFQQLDDDISRMCSGINVHNAAGEILGSLIENMDEIVCSIAERVDVSAYDIDDHLNGLDNKYTMDSERDIHRSLLSPAAREAVGGKDDNSAGDESGDGLGDNVELF